MKSATIAAMLLAATSLAACGGGSTAAEDTVTIGVVLSSTGPAAGMGELERKAVKLYEDLHGKANNIEFVYADDKSDPTEAVAAVNKMIHEDKVYAVICCTTTPASLAVREPLEQSEIVQMSVAAGAEIVEPADERPYSFKTPYTDRAVQAVGVNDMVANGVKTVGVLYLDDSYGESGKNALEDAAQEAGIDVVASESFAREATDVTAQVQSLRRANPDAYVVWAILPSANVAQEALINAGVTELVYHSFGVTTPSFLELGGDSVEGVRIANGRLVAHDAIDGDDEASQVISDFAAAYDEKFGETATGLAGFAYDAAGLLVAAAQEAGTPGDSDFTKRLRDALESTTGYIGASGTFNYSPDDHAGIDTNSLGIVVVKNGRFAPAG